MARYSMLQRLSSRTKPRARAVTSNQLQPHPRLPELLRRHRQTPFLRPPAAHASGALEQLAHALNRHGGPLVLDSGCGSGEASMAIARAHPDALIAAIDKSAVRVARAQKRRDRPANLIFLRLDVRDCWSHVLAAGWPVAWHYLFYPNPWPKQHQLMRRWHAHPVMPTLLALGGQLELRTNWQLYAQEFAYSVGFLNGALSAVEQWAPATPVGAFERKYVESGQPLYRVAALLRSS